MPRPKKEKAIKKVSTKKIYDADIHVPLAKNLVGVLGCTGPELSKVFGVSLDTINDWKRRHKDFREAWEEGSGRRAKILEDRGFQVACGYDIEETTEIYEPVVIEQDGKKVKTKELELVRVTKTRKHQPPNARMLELYLINCTDKFKPINTINVTNNTLQVGAAEQIEKLAGLFMNARKSIESEVIDVDPEESGQSE